jgi:hypothetical protein
LNRTDEQEEDNRSDKHDFQSLVRSVSENRQLLWFSRMEEEVKNIRNEIFQQDLTVYSFANQSGSLYWIFININS